MGVSMSTGMRNPAGPVNSATGRAQRLFWAIELDEGDKAAIAARRDAELRAGLSDGLEDVIKWVAPSLYHITLHFLGDVSHGAAEPLLAAVRHELTGLPEDLQRPFPLAPGALGAFGRGGLPRVLWLGLDENCVASLRALHAAVVAGSAAAGGAVEDRSFHAHITLARIKLDRAGGSGARGGARGPAPRSRMASRGGESLSDAQRSQLAALHAAVAPPGSRERPAPRARQRSGVAALPAAAPRPDLIGRARAGPTKRGAEEDREGAGGVVAAGAATEGLAFGTVVRGVSLMQSEPSREGHRYTRVALLPLNGGAG